MRPTRNDALLAVVWLIACIATLAVTFLGTAMGFASKPL